MLRCDKSLSVLAILFGALLNTGCVSPPGDTPEQQRASTLAMREVALKAVCDEHDDVKAEIDKSVGYAVFDNFGIHPGLLSFASGYGVLHNKARNRDTYLDWRRLTIGPGIAVKGLYAVVVFYDQELMEKFEQGKWTSGGQLEASFIFGDFGGAAEAAWIFSSKVDVWYVTHWGVALEGEIFGIGKFSNEEELNGPGVNATVAPD